MSDTKRVTRWANVPLWEYLGHYSREDADEAINDGRELPRCGVLEVIYENDKPVEFIFHKVDE